MSDLPAALIDSLGVTVVSLYYDLGAGLLRESDFDGDFGRFYAQLDASKARTATPDPTPPATVEDFMVVFERLLAQHGTVVVVLISSGLSKTCPNAREAVARLESEGSDKRAAERVAVIDSAGTVGKLGAQVLAAARAAAAGEGRPGVIEAARQARQEVREWALLDTLECLRRGGRIGGATSRGGVGRRAWLTLQW